MLCTIIQQHVWIVSFTSTRLSHAPPKSSQLFPTFLNSVFFGVCQRKHKSSVYVKMWCPSVCFYLNLQANKQKARRHGNTEQFYRTLPQDVYSVCSQWNICQVQEFRVSAWWTCWKWATKNLGRLREVNYEMPSCWHSVCSPLLMEPLLRNRDWSPFQKLWAVFLYVLWVSGSGSRKGWGGVFQRNAGTWLASGRKRPLLAADRQMPDEACSPGQAPGSRTECYCHRADWGRRVTTHQRGARPVTYVTASGTESRAVICRGTPPRRRRDD